MDKIELTSRWLIRRDLPQILEIEQLSFSKPWTEEEFIAKLRCRSIIGTVVERKTPKTQRQEDQILGFALYELHKSSIEVLDLAVHPDYRRQGVGSLIIQRLIDKLSFQKRNRVYVRVSEYNDAGQVFLRHVGLKAVLINREWYKGEDAYLFQYAYGGE